MTNWMPDLTQLPIAATLLAKLTVLLAAAWLLHALLRGRNPRRRVLLWRLALGGVLLLLAGEAVLPRLSVAVPASWMAPGGGRDLRANPALAQSDERTRPATGGGPATALARAAAAGGAPALAAATPGRRLGLGSLAASAEESASAAARWLAQRPSRWLMALWGAGALVLAVRLGASYSRLRRLVHVARPAPEFAGALLGQMAEAMGLNARLNARPGNDRMRVAQPPSAVNPSTVDLQNSRGFTAEGGCATRIGRFLGRAKAVLNHSPALTPHLRVADGLASPFVTGWLRPTIVLPAAMVEERHRALLPGIFAHELAHLASGDLRWMLLGRWAGVALWCHPLAWGMRRAHDAACEEVCDGVAAPYAGGAPAYSQTLARAFLELAAETPHPIAASMIRPAEIVRRIRRLRAGLLAPRLSRSWVVASLVAAVLVIGVLGGLKLVAAGSDEKPGASAKPQVSAPYESAQKSKGMRAKVGPNTFVLRHVFRMDRAGKVIRNDGTGPGTSSYDWRGFPPMPVEYEESAPWLDAATVHLGLDPQAPPDDQRYDILEVRVFDHDTKQLLTPGDGRWGAGWRRRGQDQVDLFSGGKPLPDTIDLWFRINSYANDALRVLLRPEAGESFRFPGGKLAIREVRDGEWGYTLDGGAVSWSDRRSGDSAGCTFVLDLPGKKGAGQYEVCVADRDGNHTYPDTPHFLDFGKTGSPQVIVFPTVPLGKVAFLQIRPFGGRHTFYFDGLKLPAVGNPPLVAPPALTFDIGGKEQTLRRELGPLIVDLGSYRGTWEKRSLDLGGANVQDHDAILSLWGQATDSDRCSSFLLRTDGLQVREPSIDVLDRDGLELSPINLRYFRSNVPKVAAVTKVYTFPTTPLAAVEKVVLQLAAGKNDTTTGLPKASAAGAPGATGAGQAAEAAMKDDAVQTTATFSLQFRWAAADDQRGKGEQVGWDDKRRPKEEKADLWLLPEVLMTQDDVASVGSYPDSTPAGSTVFLKLTAEGTKRFAALTEQGLRRRLAIVLNGIVLTAPTIMSKIPNGAVQISGLSKVDADGLVASIRAANPAVAIAAQAEPVFGPVEEQVLRQTGEDCMVDFDKGRLITSPVGLQGTEKWLEWAAENGVDAGASGGSAPRGLIGMDLILDPRPNDSWDTEIAQNLLNAEVFRVAKAGNPVYMSAEGKLPVTYAFKTREGGIGLVQILEFMDQEPRGTKIRYKMVLRPDATPLPAASDPTTQTTSEGERLWQEGKLPEAEKKFLEAVVANPKDADAWNGLGWARFRQGASPAAKDAFEKCIALDPQQAGALNGLGWIAKADGKTDEAIARWNQAIEAVPNATAALSGLATTYMEKGQYELAAGIYEKWLQAEPNNAQVTADLERAKSHKPVVALDDLPHLIQELSNPSAPRFEALNRIVQAGSPAVPALIEEMKTNGNWQIPKALGAIGDKRAVESLIEKLEKNPRWSPMREVVGEALTLLTGQKLEPDAKAWREWWNKNGKSATPKEPADGGGGKVQ